MAQNFSGTTMYIVDDAGLPVPGALICTYEAGTLTNKAAFTTPLLDVPASNPIEADASGHAQFVLGPGAYRIKVFRPGPGAELTKYAADNQTSPSATDTALRADLLSAASATVGAGLVGNSVFNCASRTILKAVVMAVNPSVYLTEAGRRGLFVWTTGDFSTHVAADTQEGVYIKATAVSAASGAWVRATTDDELWQTDWFGVPNASSDGTGTACQSQYNAMMATANLVSPAGIQFGSGVYSMDTAPTAPTFICTIAGTKSSTQPTIVVKRYVDTAAGLLAGGAYALRVLDLSVQAIGSGISAGNLAISMILPSATNVGEPLLENVRTSMGTSNSAEILIDGMAASSGTLGYRTGNMRNVQCFGSLVMRGCHHWFGSEMFIAGDLVLTGTSAVPCNDIHMTGIIGRNLDIGAASDTTGFVTLCTWHGNVQNSILNTANTSRFLVFGDYGTIAERDWDVTTCRTYSQASIEDYGSNGSGIYVKFGNGKMQQFGSVNTSSGSATVTFPTPFLSTVTFKDANVSTAPASGFIELAQAHSATLSGMSIRSMSFSTAPATGLSSATVDWYAEGE